MTDYAQTIATMAAKYGLDPSLVTAVIQQESGGDTNAVRLEQAFYQRYVKPLPNLSPGERVDRSVSWGLMQVMGQVARELGYTDSLPALCQPWIGIEYGCKHLANKIKAAGGNVTHALLLWNGGSDPNYPAEVLARLKSPSTSYEGPPE